MKKFFTGLLVGIILSFTAVAFADQPIRLIVNGKEVPCDPPPLIINGRTFVPIRFVSEALGAKVNWNEKQQVVIINSSNSVSLITNDEVISLKELKTKGIIIEMTASSEGTYIKTNNHLEFNISVDQLFESRNKAIITEVKNSNGQTVGYIRLITNPNTGITGVYKSDLKVLNII